jgi:hypothetical protein
MDLRCCSICREPGSVRTIKTNAGLCPNKPIVPFERGPVPQSADPFGKGNPATEDLVAGGPDP